MVQISSSHLVPFSVLLPSFPPFHVPFLTQSRQFETPSRAAIEKCILYIFNLERPLWFH